MNRPRLPRFSPGLFSLGALCLLLSACQTPEPAARHATPSLPKAALPSRLLVGANHTFTPAELVTLATLQGQLARAGGENLYLNDTDLPSGYGVWLDLLARQPGVSTEPLPDFAATLARFRARFPDYVLYRSAEPESLAVALALARPLHALLIEETLAPAALAAGLRPVADARGRALAGLTPAELAAAAPAPDLVIEQPAALPAQLRDYALFTGTLTFPAANSPASQAFMARYPAGSLALGWGDDSHDGERDFIGRDSRLGIPLIPANHVRNLTVLSALPASGPLRQQKPASPAAVSPSDAAAPAPAAEHTVTFVLTDGDNLSWLLYDFPTDPRWFGSPQRGRIPLGWGMAPALAELSPGVVEWYYKNARGAAPGEARDVFVAGPSGTGYFYPSQMPPDALARECARLDRLMANADLGLVQIIDFDALDRTDIWENYLRQPHIDGLLYCDYAPYDKGKGRIVWAAGKPVVSARAMLWSGVAGSDVDSVARQLNAASRDQRSAAGYSLVVVHAWTHSVADVVRLAAQLRPDVRVVAPDEFMQRVQRHVTR